MALSRFCAMSEMRSIIQIYGNQSGLKASQVQQLERLYRRKLPPDQLLNHDFAKALSTISHEIRRQVGVLLDRRGTVTHVIVGDAHSITMPDWGRLRAGRGRLRGLRCVHTHLGDEGLTNDDLTDLALLRLDAMIAIETQSDGLPGHAHIAALRAANQEGKPVEILNPILPSKLDLDFPSWIHEREEEFARQTQTKAVARGERAILVCIATGERHGMEPEDSMAELRELARSADVQVVHEMTQHRARLDPKTLMGAGKLQELVIQALWHDADLVIFDQNLNPTQARNLAERTELRVIDRTQLILDIFAQRAKSRDGKLQVELAQLKYRLPRLVHRDDSLSRLGAGIGGRGPGETKLEIDRRRVRERITHLERELKKMRQGRQERRRRRHGLPVVSIVGYTNAGKSTLLHALTQSSVHIADKMFATLDPASRRLRFPRERDVIITDTVGFIRDLPPDLVTAFRATLEELEEADVLLHVVDASAPDFERRIESVHRILDELGLYDRPEGKRPEILVLNQIDRLSPEEAIALAERFDAISISALKKIGLNQLLLRVDQVLWQEESHSQGTPASIPQTLSAQC